MLMAATRSKNFDTDCHCYYGYTALIAEARSRHFETVADCHWCVFKATLLAAGSKERAQCGAAAVGPDARLNRLIMSRYD